MRYRLKNRVYGESRHPHFQRRNRSWSKKTTDALKILADIAGKAPEMQRMFEEEVANREVAQKIYQLRTKAGPKPNSLAGSAPLSP